MTKMTIAQTGHYLKSLQMENTKYELAYRRCMDDPSVSYLFKEVLKKYDSRDSVDALNDAEMLVAVMRLKNENSEDRFCSSKY